MSPYAHIQETILGKSYTIATGYCNQCGTYNSSSIRCECANKVLSEVDSTPTINLDEPDLTYEEHTDTISPTDLTPSYYGAKCKCGAKLDPYIICDAYATNPNKGSAWHHAVKKLLRAGDGHKPLTQDIQEVIATLKRWQEQINA